MCQNPTTGGIVSESELATLSDLFQQFEGATDPLSSHCREAESEFNAVVEKIYTDKVKPAFPSIPLFQFLSYTRHQCRLRIFKQGPPFPCV
jgi:hypothetical protein